MLLFTVVAIFSIGISVLAQYSPKRLPWYDWPDRLMFMHLIRMTAELVKDATYKLRHAEKIRDMHSHSITYELGSIAAGIQERFQRMLILYKKYANLEDFEKATYTVPEIMNAYHLMQGDYNEIRLEKSLFHDIVKKHESTHSPKNKKPTKPKSGGRKQMKWSVNRDMY